jgi:hypothetical protein
VTKYSKFLILNLNFWFVFDNLWLVCKGLRLTKVLFPMKGYSTESCARNVEILFADIFITNN